MEDIVDRLHEIATAEGTDPAVAKTCRDAIDEIERWRNLGERLAALEAKVFSSA